jgi:hypothetical protein
MHMMRRILTRQESCLSLLALLMVCAITSCAAPVSNKNTSTNHLFQRAADAEHFDCVRLHCRRRQPAGDQRP